MSKTQTPEIPKRVYAEIEKYGAKIIAQAITTNEHGRRKLSVITFDGEKCDVTGRFETKDAWAMSSGVMTPEMIREAAAWLEKRS